MGKQNNFCKNNNRPISLFFLSSNPHSSRVFRTSSPSSIVPHQKEVYLLVLWYNFQVIPKCTFYLSRNDYSLNFDGSPKLLLIWLARPHVTCAFSILYVVPNWLQWLYCRPLPKPSVRCETQPLTIGPWHRQLSDHLSQCSSCPFPTLPCQCWSSLQRRNRTRVSETETPCESSGGNLNASHGQRMWWYWSSHCNARMKGIIMIKEQDEEDNEEDPLNKRSVRKRKETDAGDLPPQRQPSSSRRRVTNDPCLS